MNCKTCRKRRTFDPANKSTCGHFFPWRITEYVTNWQASHDRYRLFFDFLPSGYKASSPGGASRRPIPSSGPRPSADVGHLISSHLYRSAGSKSLRQLYTCLRGHPDLQSFPAIETDGRHGPPTLNYISSILSTFQICRDRSSRAEAAINRNIRKYPHVFLFLFPVFCFPLPYPYRHLPMAVLTPGDRRMHSHTLQLTPF